jgi:CTD small phosphatase-like protein 2
MVLDRLDTSKAVSYRLYRQHTSKMGNVFIKDLSKLGRDISRVIIIDNVADNFELQRENGLHIKNFLGDENDNELSMLTEDLISIKS